MEQAMSKLELNGTASKSDSQVYAGEEKMILAIDFGTTTSAVSYRYLYPGTEPVARSVTDWPGQPEERGSSKVPTKVAYKDGVVIALGAQAEEYVDEEGCEIAEWFKLRLHPDVMNKEGETGLGPNSMDIPPLPKGVQLIDVYSDFFRYLYESTRQYFTNRVPNGTSIWTKLEGSGAINFILAIPNGWEASQFAFLRRAAIKGGLVDEKTADERIDYVTEGEASVHYVLAHSQSKAWLKEGVVFAVIDAGGSTVDSNLYKCKSISPKLVLEEVCASECVQAGGVFVDRSARTMLKNVLEGSEFCEAETIKIMVDHFEKRTKRLFDGTQASNVISFGRKKDTNRSYNIVQGKLSLTRYEVSSTFESAVGMIVKSCTRLTAGRDVKHVLLVGGFGESPFLKKRLREIFADRDTELVSVDEPLAKAAADGAAIWYLKRQVDGRAARFAIGTSAARLFNLFNPYHRQRLATVHKDAEGDLTISGVFHQWVEKNEIMVDDMRKEFNYQALFRRIPLKLEIDDFKVLCTDGSETPYWAENATGGLAPGIRTLCCINANLETMRPYIKPQTRPDGETYYELTFRVVVWFGGTKLRARVQWNEGGQLREGPASIIPSSTY